MQNDKNYLSLEDPKLLEQLHDARRNHAGLTVPDDFFAQFERKMNAVIDAAEEAKKAQQAPQPIPLQPKAASRRWLSIAALALIVIAAGMFLYLGAAGNAVSEANPASLNLASADASTEVSADESAADLVADEMTVAATDYDIFDLYCDL